MTGPGKEFWQTIFILLLMLFLTSCAGPRWSGEQPVKSGEIVFDRNLSHVLDPELEDRVFFRAIAEEQEKQLGVCADEQTCLRTHFLRGVSALYENRELAALHFRKVVTSAPNSVLAGESRFWLWFLDVLNAPDNAGLTSYDLIKRITREVVKKEMAIHELMEQLDNASVDEDLTNKLVAQDEIVKRQKQAIVALTTQLEQAKVDQALLQKYQQDLESSEKKVEELAQQLEALRRIDQEIREKVPPTRPSENMTPSPDVENPLEIQEPFSPDSQP